MPGAAADGFLADWQAEAARSATEIVISEQVLLIFIRIYNLPPNTDLQNWDYLMVLPSILMVNAEPTLPRLLTGWPIDCFLRQQGLAPEPTHPTRAWSTTNRRGFSTSIQLIASKSGSGEETNISGGGRNHG